ncbi:DUF2971 domain-containing protein [Rubritalea profundi]|uniref:DUF2971 domain-containing protein n=1 Tax=Rubritalea profundi TaxID=1658618 RepID=A0A2S7U798_9BACT|nr:DUF2971 domain-containing protein [Rubritalea profundi]PQJ30172.1 hypothetical protein BSZ32_17970 [Rubritalea profundi]
MSKRKKNRDIPSPDTIYRYLDLQAGLATLEQKEFKVSRLSQLNDPFEWLPTIIDWQDTKNLTPHDIELAQREMMATIGELLGIICFSGRSDLPALWAHYAQEHQGIAIGVSASSPCFSRVDNPPKPINYDDRRIKIKWRDLSSSINGSSASPEFSKALTDLGFRKGENWEYENEYRALFRLKECETVKNGMYFVKSDDTFKITEIIVGANCRVDPGYFKKSLELHGYSNVKVFKSRLRKDKHLMEKVPV